MVGAEVPRLNSHQRLTIGVGHSGIWQRFATNWAIWRHLTKRKFTYVCRESM
jgi:hypothetical protein